MAYIPAPPSNLSGPAVEYLRILWRAVNDLPTISKYSGVTPNGVISGYPGDLAVNLTSTNTDKRLWQLSGAARSMTSQGWVQV